MKYLWILVLAVAVSGCVSTQNSPETASAIVTDVTDGDTVDVRMKSGRDTVRLLGVDTPEKYGEVNPEEFNISDTEEGRECLKNWAYNATQFVESRISDRNVTLTFDRLEDRRGSYGRLLAYVSLNQSRSINYRLLRRGYARLYDTPFERRNEFLSAELMAQRNSRGLWSCTG